MIMRMVRLFAVVFLCSVLSLVNAADYITFINYPYGPQECGAGIPTYVNYEFEYCFNYVTYSYKDAVAYTINYFNEVDCSGDPYFSEDVAYQCNFPRGFPQETSFSLGSYRSAPGYVAFATDRTCNPAIVSTAPLDTCVFANDDTGRVIYSCRSDGVILAQRYNDNACTQRAGAPVRVYEDRCSEIAVRVIDGSACPAATCMAPPDPSSPAPARTLDIDYSCSNQEQTSCDRVLAQFPVGQCVLLAGCRVPDMSQIYAFISESNVISFYPEDNCGRLLRSSVQLTADTCICGTQRQGQVAADCVSLSPRDNDPPICDTSSTSSAFNAATTSVLNSATTTALNSATTSAIDSATTSALDSVTTNAVDSATTSAFDAAITLALNSATTSAFDSAVTSALNSATTSALNLATTAAAAALSGATISSSSSTGVISGECPYLCPSAPFFSVNGSMIYVCFLSRPVTDLDANIRYADGTLFNWHPREYTLDASLCIVLEVPTSSYDNTTTTATGVDHGMIVWAQVDGFDCHYGEDNTGREENCGWNICQPSCGLTTTTTIMNSVTTAATTAVATGQQVATTSIEAARAMTSATMGVLDIITTASAAATTAAAATSIPITSASIQPLAITSSLISSTSAAAATAAAATTTVSITTSSPSTCPYTCPRAPFFTVNDTMIYACFTVLPDSAMDANIRYEDCTIFNWHPSNYTLDANDCIQFLVPSDDDVHGPIVWTQVNGFDCHFGENNSGREENCGWNLCKDSCSSSSSSTSSSSSSSPSSSTVTSTSGLSSTCTGSIIYDPLTFVLVDFEITPTPSASTGASASASSISLYAVQPSTGCRVLVGTIIFASVTEATVVSFTNLPTANYQQVINSVEGNLDSFGVTLLSKFSFSSSNGPVSFSFSFSAPASLTTSDDDVAAFDIAPTLLSLLDVSVETSPSRLVAVEVNNKATGEIVVVSYISNAVFSAATANCAPIIILVSTISFIVLSLIL
eukprot:TRINITY_DN8051_c0_g1_i9.p1 TRINITY_DN8051_c0_g1~~TRINITY_DN8051_c0_g1_i9.p1  ORF type:complete len:984 (+),score=195.84 TRINITY_DN8051_c0_g1_i9:128-3079(+)